MQWLAGGRRRSGNYNVNNKRPWQRGHVAFPCTPGTGRGEALRPPWRSQPAPNQPRGGDLLGDLRRFSALATALATNLGFAEAAAFRLIRRSPARGDPERLADTGRAPGPGGGDSPAALSGPGIGGRWPGGDCSRCLRWLANCVTRRPNLILESSLA